jgi:excisionase family DNA binding protein
MGTEIEQKTVQIAGQQQFLTVGEVAQILQVTRATVYGWVFRRIIPHFKVGRFVRVAPDDLKGFLQLRRRGDSSSIATGRTQTRPERW